MITAGLQARGFGDIVEQGAGDHQFLIENKGLDPVLLNPSHQQPGHLGNN